MQNPNHSKAIGPSRALRDLGKKAGTAHQHSSLLPSPLAELNSHVSKAALLVELYEKHANSEIRNESELGHVQREMKVIKSEILSELVRSKGALQQLQRETKG